MVYLDAGYGGNDNSVENNELKDATLALTILKEIEKVVPQSTIRKSKRRNIGW